MDDNTRTIYRYTQNNAEKEEMRQEGEKGGQSWYTAWYEFESDSKKKDDSAEER